MVLALLYIDITLRRGKRYRLGMRMWILDRLVREVRMGGCPGLRRRLVGVTGG